MQNVDIDEKNLKLQKKIEIGLAVVIILAIIIIIVAIIIKQLNKKSYIDLTVAPSSASIVINGQEYKNGNYQIEPGEYLISLTADNFGGKEISVKVSNGETVSVQEFLLPIGETIEYYDDYPDEVEILRNMADNTEAQEFVSEFDQKYSIAEILPIKYAEYSSGDIDFRVERGDDDLCEKWFCLVIKDAVGNGEETALQKIIDNGYEPSDYEIHYLNTSEP